MKHNDEQDSRIEKMLHELPQIKDTKSKDDYYRLITNDSNQNSSGRPRWLFPGIASVIAVLILAVVVPFSYYSVKEGAIDQPQSAEQHNFKLEKSKSFSSGNDLSLKTNQESTAHELQSMVVEDISSNMKPLAAVDQSVQHIVPLTVVSEKNEREGSNINTEQLGLSENILENITISIDENEDKAQVTFPNNFSVSGNAMSTSIVNSIKWSVEPYNVEEISIQTEDGSQVSLGSYGKLSSLSVIEEGSFIFKVFKPSSSDTSFFVPVSIKNESTISTALKELKKDEKDPKVDSPLPPEVTVQSAHEEGNELIVELNHPESVDKQKMLTAIESILMTAQHFGYDRVEFENTSIGKLGPYELSKTVETPKGLNPVPAEE
ncbi:GerMN domain-containing protein [Halobacillus hunanensis]|uniref:GerMN domain-containing protein n=1 Tax=Halobacillus hunanensis TaxID=578214 RepID=UPI0009A7EFCF|nr:GerMN domain-containing protein [Halobacillus hunanensis]